MAGLEVTVLLGIAILVGTALAPRLRIATPLVLVVIGLLLGFVPALRDIQLPPETVLLLFLPVMLFWESLTTSLRAVRRSLRYIVPMSTLLVVASAFAVAWIATLFGVPFHTALLLGAAVAPPDATAVAALGRLLPERMFMKLKAESLTNDGTALVLYAIALSLALGENVTGWSITGMIAVSYLGGAAAGIAVAALAYVLLRRAHHALVINTTLLLVPFVAFLLAEIIGASGVLAVVFAGLIVAWSHARITTATSRRQALSAWPFGVYLLNGALFVLIGLEVQYVVHDVPARQLGILVVITIATWIALIVVRYLFQLLFAPFSRPSGAPRFGHHRGRVVNTFAGFRGAVSLAIALSVPASVAGIGEPGELTGRDIVVFVTGGVILLSLLVQGPLLPAIVRWARLPADESAADEYELAQRTITGAAVAALDDLAAEHGISNEVRDRARRETYEYLELANARAYARQSRADAASIAELETMLGAPDTSGDAAGAVAGANPVALTAAPAVAASPAAPLEMIATSDGIDLTQRSPITRFEEATRLRLAVLDRKRAVLQRLRREGTIDDLVVRRIEGHLDIDELRLRGLDQADGA
ncbi:MAG: Na+/H+ antiporter [Microbacterium sp.]|uniref:Na+/H+ antiporter n=1 Tax=Microbacterium sp. TaxID=51671 RepID=UPI001AD5518A|nr:Na+/H+ antiporter [Microbacterium sp.]MBN9178644.1 Na+/H+ antiporter [Microbacterium sp.]